MTHTVLDYIVRLYSCIHNVIIFVQIKIFFFYIYFPVVLFLLCDSDYKIA